MLDLFKRKVKAPVDGVIISVRPSGRVCICTPSNVHHHIRVRVPKVKIGQRVKKGRSLGLL